MPDLPHIWAFLLSFAVLAYVVLDGFDLGVGILFLFLRDAGSRDLAINSVAPVWDGNETWLVFGGAGLLAAFPLAYSILLPAFYIPLTLMLLCLVFRGVAFEFRWRDDRHKLSWDRGFMTGSILATCMQGMMLGTFVRGIEVSDRTFAGTWLDWISPFSLLTGVALVLGYALLGVTWLILKTEGVLQERLFRLLPIFVMGTLTSVAAVSLWTPLLSPDIADIWYAWPDSLLLWAIPVAVLILGLTLLSEVRSRKSSTLYPLTLLIYSVSFLGIGVSVYPYLVPRELTIAAAAAPHSSLAFLLVGSALLLPVILAYTGYTYWLFRGKARAGDSH